MTQLSHSIGTHSGVASPLAAWLLPSAVVIGGVVAAALIAARIMAPLPGSEAAAPELPSIGTIIGASAPEAAPAQISFAFGFLEFDWDPNAPGGVPGFGPWPKQDLRVADASAGE